jgi:hypothetical protein
MSDSPQQDALNMLKLLLEHLQNHYNIAPDDALRSITEKEEFCVPLSVFERFELTFLEALIKYLHENQNMRFSEIAKSLNKNPVSVWGCYKKSKTKHPNQFSVDLSKGEVPLVIFTKEKFTISEALVHYLSTEKKMRYIEIAQLLHRDSRTVWSLAKRALKKNEE